MLNDRHPARTAISEKDHFDEEVDRKASAHAEFTRGCAWTTIPASLAMARLPHRAGLISGFRASGPNFASGFLQIHLTVDTVAFD